MGTEPTPLARGRPLGSQHLAARPRDARLAAAAEPHRDAASTGARRALMPLPARSAPAVPLASRAVHVVDLLHLRRARIDAVIRKTAARAAWPMARRRGLRVE